MTSESNEGTVSLAEYLSVESQLRMVADRLDRLERAIGHLLDSTSRQEQTLTVRTDSLETRFGVIESRFDEVDVALATLAPPT